MVDPSLVLFSECCSVLNYRWNHPVYDRMLDLPSSQSILPGSYYRNCANSFHIVVLSCLHCEAFLPSSPDQDVSAQICTLTEPVFRLCRCRVRWETRTPNTKGDSKSKLFQPRIGKTLLKWSDHDCLREMRYPSIQKKNSTAIGRSVQVEVWMTTTKEIMRWKGWDTKWSVGIGSSIFSNSIRSRNWMSLTIR